MQECGWRDGGLPNEDGRRAVYVGDTTGVHEIAGDPTDTPKPEFMFVTGPYGSDACAQTTLRLSPVQDWDCCIVGEGMYGA
jgi:hypothetical protein